MREALTPISLALLFAALAFCGCTRKANVVSGSRLAVTRSNQETKRLYHIEPFKEEHGLWRSEGQQRSWQALASSGGHDFTAKVAFDEKGDVLNVEVQMLTPPILNTSTNVPPLLGPEMQPEKKLGVPEVMPK